MKESVRKQEMEAALTAALAENKRLRGELDRFLYAVSHDLQRPIRHARSFAQVLKHCCQEGRCAETLGFADRVVEASVEAQVLLEGLLRLSRISKRGKPCAPVDCNAVLDAAEEYLAPIVERSGTRIRRGSLPIVTADADQLEEVFAHLIDNAVIFRREDRAPQIEIRAEEREGEWLFAVSDNGIGIDPKQHERIFVVFCRLHTAEEYPGLGFGLAFCKAIVERHRGRLWVDSEPDRGWTFYFTLPGNLPEGTCVSAGSA